MKQVLVDTHVFMWFVNWNRRLSKKARTTIEETDTRYLSVVSVWEMAIKISMGKLDMKTPFEYIEIVLQEDNFTLLPIKLEHTQQLIALPFYHKDPFDRLLIAQAMVEQIPIVSIDGHFEKYSIPIVW